MWRTVGLHGLQNLGNIWQVKKNQHWNGKRGATGLGMGNGETGAHQEYTGEPGRIQTATRGIFPPDIINGKVPCRGTVHLPWFVLGYAFDVH